jgi:hypothetical protein
MKRSPINGSRVNFSRGHIVLPNNYRAALRNMSVPTEAAIFSNVETQAYPLGSKLYLGDQIYRYIRAGEAMAAGTQGFLKCNYAQCPGKAGNSVHSGFEGALYADVDAGDTSFQIADTTAVAHEYEGAYFVVYDDTNHVYESHRVIDNDASDGATTTCYIASPGFKNDLTTSMGITVYLSPYYDVRQFATGGGYASALGYAKFAITSHYFLWLQTSGPISGVTGASTWPGQTQYYRDVYANTDGSLIGYTAGYQRIGYLLSRTASDYGDNFIMLQLDN